MSLLKTSPIKNLLMVILICLSNLVTAQISNPNHVLGTPCTNCPAPPKYSPPTVMDGNQANVTSYTASACGLNYVFASVKLGKRAPLAGVTQPAAITISGLPTGCTTILKAFLYGDASGNGIAVTSTVTNPALVATAFPMTIIGTSPDKCWSYSGSYSYRADITSCITGNGNYMVSGLPTNPPTSGNDFDGATIVIIYADPTQTYTGHLVIADGAHVAAPGSITDVISMPAACANSTYADGFIIVGDLQGIANTPFRLNSAVPNYTFPAASNGWWNAFQATAAPVTAGQTSATFGAQNSGDCYNVVVSGLYYRTTCNTCTFSPGTMSLTTASSSSCTTGTATANPVGGTGPYTYSWTPGSATTQTISGAPGIYTVTVKDAACNQVTSTVAISALAPININVTTTQPSCLNPPGTSTAIVSGGSTASGFTVSWSPTPGTVTPTGNGSIASGLTAGTTTATVTDISGCSTSTVFNVTAPAIASFSLNTIGVATLTCINPSVTISAINTSTLGNITYTWMPGNVNGTTFNATSVGVYTVIGQDLVAGSCPITQTFAVTQNTTVPNMTVTPATTQTLLCNGSCKTFTAISTGTSNIVGTWNDIGGVIVGPSGTPLILCANSPGTYTASFCSSITGCCNQTTVAVVSNTSIPTLTITPTTMNGFTINCTNPKVVMVINSSGTLAPIGYTWTPLSNPSASTTPAAGGFTASVPGQYEAAFHDGNLCTVTTTVTVFIDTLRPSPLSMTDLPSNSYTINCFTPSLVATALTNPMLSPSSYSWTTPGPLTLPYNTISVSMGNITSSVTGVTYTVSAMGANGCLGKAKVSFYKDIYIPNYTPVSTPSAITCGNPCVAMSPFSTTTTPISFTLTSPPPTQTATTAGALMCIPGTYTMNYINQLNGCGKTATVAVAQNVIPPAINVPAIVYLPCGQTTTIVSANTVTTSNTYSYTWTGPAGSAMSCLGGTACASPSVNMPGYYVVDIFNTVNGCTSTNTIFVEPGILHVDFTANPYTGFAPLSVNFDNTTSLSSTSGGTVQTIWNYGNGITFTASGTSASYSLTGAPDGSTIYQSAGNYTVTLLVQQITGLPLAPGMPPNACIGTATAVIHVELPSELEIPNVFTPNGDGVNDVFFLQTTNLTEITCLIYDRWGVKMYDVTSDKGNIAWDGKNFGNKDVPAGTYFYIIKAKGKDLKDYEYKGTVTLFR